MRVRLVCHRSPTTWTMSARRVMDRPGRLTAICPSCGRRLELEQTPAGPELVTVGRNGQGRTHQIVAR